MICWFDSDGIIFGTRSPVLFDCYDAALIYKLHIKAKRMILIKVDFSFNPSSVYSP